MARDLVVVSHDRTFLSRTTDRLLEVHNDGLIADVPGGIDAWISRAMSGTSSSATDNGNESSSVSRVANCATRKRTFRALRGGRSR